jgi:hypothetical protein
MTLRLTLLGADTSPVNTLVITSWHGRKLSPHLKFMFDLLLTLFPTTITTSADTARMPANLACFAKLFISPFPEEMFSSRTQALTVRQFLERKIPPFISGGQQSPLNLSRSCPLPRAILLYRSEGLGGRTILNFDVLDRVLSAFGIEYTNVTISSLSTTVEQAHLFSTVGLVISSHSSQLKNVVFAVDNTVVIEVKPLMWSDAFERSTEHLHIVHKHSINHTADMEQVQAHPSFRSRPDRALILADFHLNETILRHDLHEALEVQRTRCGYNIWAKASQNPDTQ